MELELKLRVILSAFIALVAAATLPEDATATTATTTTTTAGRSRRGGTGRNNPKNAKKKKNILLLLTDDQDVALGSFDHMPHVMRHVREGGVCFEGGGFVHTPVCCPSRSSILTGRYLHAGRGGMAINNSLAGNCYGPEWRSTMEAHHTFAVHAKDRQAGGRSGTGYTTAFCGKYLNQYRADDDTDDTDFPAPKTKTSSSIPPGWDYWYGLEGNSRYYNTTIVEGRPGPNATTTVVRHVHGNRYPDDYLPLLLRNYTLNLLRTTLREPWIMVVAWPTPHAPFTPEPWADGIHRDHHAPRDAPNYNATESSQRQKHWIMRQLQPLTVETENVIDDYYRMRLDALVTVDMHVRALVETLSTTSSSGRTPDSKDMVEEDGTPSSTLLDRTVIMYTSDNGFQFGQHRLAIDKVTTNNVDACVCFCFVLSSGIFGLLCFVLARV
jgi:N-acetylglucosamine-6-sulfatase